MITTKLGNGRVFLHNGDYSGDLLINVSPKEVEKLDPAPGEPPTMRVTIPFDDIKTIVAEYVLRNRTREMRDASADDLLGVRTVANVVAELERIHVDRDGYCNTCGGQYPCLTLRIARGEPTT